MHVPYECRDSGACCSSGWPIPLERSRVAVVQVLRQDGSWLRPAIDAPPDIGGVLAVSRNGHCVFHGDGCEVQRALGPAAMPTACQHFPREVLIDRRGVFVTLSHYCPTAADLLFQHSGAVAIVEGPPVLSMGDPEGLDARGVLPPLLVDGVLTDDDGYSAWEAHVVGALTRDDDRLPEQTLGELWRDLAIVQRWRPGPTSLTDWIARLSPNTHPPRLAKGHQAHRVIRRYLAARAFASWLPYQGNGIAAGLGGLALALSELRDRIARVSARGCRGLSDEGLKDAIRATDLRLVHEMPRAELVERANHYCRRQMSNSATSGP